VLGKNGGALGEMIPSFAKAWGVLLGSGKQWFSWIHEMDLVRIYLFLMGKKAYPDPLTVRPLSQSETKT